MRILFPLIAAAALLAACSDKKSPQPTPRASEVSTTVKLINLPPKDLILPAGQMIAGAWKSEEGTLADPQFNRAWNRDPADPGAATGATRITITARLYKNLDDSADDCAESATGPDALEFIYQTLISRGFLRENIRPSQPPLDQLGGECQSFWRAEFSRSTETNVQYFAFVHVKNTRALITAFAASIDGKEAPQLLDDMKQATRKQADYMLSLPTITTGARTPGIPTPTPTATP
jgi:hypothetical protein